jgi:DNA-binding beta-propeller fold protein YncE
MGGMDGVDPGEIASRATEEREEQRSHAKTVLEWLLDDSRVGEMYPRSELMDEVASDTDLDPEEVAAGVRGAVGDLVDPVQQVLADGEKYVGIIEYNRYSEAGAYGYVQYHDRFGERKRVVCAKCVEEADLEENVTHATEGVGTADDNASWADLLDLVVSHYETDHDASPDQIEPGASLVSGSTIGGNTAFHAGNDGDGSDLDADTLRGNGPGDLGIGDSIPVVDEAVDFTESNVTLSGRLSAPVDGAVGVNYPNVQSPSYQENFGLESDGPRSMAFNGDGTKLYVVYEDTTKVYSYPLSTAYDVTTADLNTFDNLYDTGTISSPTGIAFNNDGTKMYLLNADNNVVTSFTLSTAYDTSTASENNSLDVARPGANEVIFNDDGSKMYIASQSNSAVYSLELSTPFDISTATQANKLSTTGPPRQEDGPTGLAFNSDGTKIFVVGRTQEHFVSYTLSTPYDISTGSLNKVFDPSEGSFWHDIVFTNDGRTANVVGDSPNQINKYELTPPDGLKTVVEFPSRDNVTEWDVLAQQRQLDGGSVTVDVIQPDSTEFQASFDVSDEEVTPRGFAFKDDGTKMYVIGSNTDSVHSYTLSTAYDITTASFQSQFDVSGQATYPTGMEFNGDGTKMFVSCLETVSVYSYTLSTAYDITTASFQSQFDVSGQDGTPYGVTFSSSGSKMFVAGFDTNTIYSYTLSTAYDITTATSQASFDASVQDDGMYAVSFSPDGTKMFLTAYADADAVYSYTLSTAYDITTALSRDRFDVSAQDTNPHQARFSDDGTKLFIIGNDSDSVHSYSLGGAYELVEVLAANAAERAGISSLPTGKKPSLRIRFDSVPNGAAPRLEYVARRGFR